MTVARAAIAYWAVVFALGFVLGTIRVLWLAPMIGLLPATALELPVMLGASWFAADWVLLKFAIGRPFAALLMGAMAFALLLAAEYALAAVLIGQSPPDWLAGLRESHALLGLAGQVVFALMPWLIVLKRSRH